MKRLVCINCFRSVYCSGESCWSIKQHGIFRRLLTGKRYAVARTTHCFRLVDFVEGDQ